MKNSRLRKKSPAFRQGYRTGCAETLREKIHTIKTSDDVDDNDTWQGYVDRMKGQEREEYLAGDMEGYRRGYSDGRDQEKESGVSGIVVGVVVGMAAVGGFLIGFAL